MLPSIEFPNILPFVLFVTMLSNCFAFYCSILLCVWHALIKKLSNRWILGKKITDYFCFLPPPFLSPTWKLSYYFCFQPPLLPPTLKIVRRYFYALNQSILILSLLSFCVNCLCSICLPCSGPSFFLWQVFFFAFNLEQHPIVCPLKFRIMGCFSLS